MGKSKKQKTASSTTSLSSQLANLKKAEPAPVVAHTYVSFLFERQQASLISTDTIWNLANEGLQELIKLDSRFSPFEHTLFSFSSKQLVRDLQTRDENQKLDVSIGSFLQLLSPYFMQKSAHKVIEYLLRRYSIDQFNVDQIFSCILPYHETNLFGRMVQILRINESTLWSFLSPIKKSGTPLSHDLLIERSLRDYGLIEFICSSVKSAIAHQASFRTLTSFYGVLLTQILAKPVQLDNDLLNRVIPYIFDGLQSNNLEYQLASYMIVSQISYRSELSSGLLDSLLDSISKYATDLSLNDSLLCLIFLTQSQSISKFTSKTILNLSKQSQFPLRLVTLFQKGYDMSKFMALYFKEAMQLSFKEPLVFQMLNKIIVDVPLHNYIVELTSDFVEGYLKHYSSNKSSVSDLDDSVNKFIKLVDRKYPQDLDKALSQNMKKYSDNKEKKALLMNFMNKIFSGTRHELLGNSDSTLFLSLEHPEATVRLNALQQLKQIISKNKEFSPSDNQYIQDAVARRLVDENEDIVKFILQTPLLFQQVDPTTLLDTSKSMLNSESHSEDIKYSVLLFLSNFISSSIDTAMIDTVLSLVLSKLVDDIILSEQTDRSQSINRLVKLLENIDHPLVKNASSIKGEPINSLVELVSKNYASKYEQVKDNVSQLMQDSKVQLFLVASLNATLANPNTSTTIKHNITNEILAPLCISKIDDIKNSNATLSINATPIDMIKNNGQLIYNTIANIIRYVSSNEIELLRNVYLSVTSLTGVSFKSVFDIVSLILQTHFRANPLQFLVYFWTTYGDNNNIKELNVLRSLEYCNGYLNSVQSQSYDFQLLLPSLLVPLRHDSKMIRSAVLNCLSSMNTGNVKSVWCKDQNNLYAITKLNDSCYLNSDLYVLLISSICNQSHGLLQDSNFVLSLLSQISSISKKDFTAEKMADVQKYLIQHSAYLQSIYAKLTLLQIVSNYKSNSDLLNSYKSTLVDDLLKPSAINKNTSLLILLLVKQFNSNNVKLVEGDAYKTLVHILDSLDVNIIIDSRQVSVKKLLVEELNVSKLYSKLSQSKQKELFFKFCKLIMNEQNGTIRDEITKLLQSVELDADLITSELQSHFIDEDNSANTKTTPKSKKQKSSQFTKMDDIVGQLPKLNIPLEILNISDIKIKNSETLVKPLFQILSFLVEKVTFKKGDDIEYSVEYSKQILLTSLISIIQNIDKSLFKSIQSDIHIESLLYCLKDSSNPQTHQKVLLLLSAISPVFPSLILDQIMPLFTYMGASVLTQDDNYTFQVIQKTVESIIPSIIESGSTVKSVLDIFVKSINNIPVHRRVHLFQVLLRTVSSKYIPGMLLLLLHSNLANSSAISTSNNESTNSTNLVAFTHNLLNEFSPFVVTKSLMEILTFAVHIPVDSSSSIRENAIANRLYDFCPLKVEKDVLTICLMKQIIMEFITDHIASKTFLDKLLHYESEEEQQTIQKLCLQILELLLELQQQATTKSKEKKSTQHNQIWKGIIDMGYTAIDNLNQLLSVSAFVNAISQLLQNSDDKIRRRALVLFNEKISQEKDTLTEVEYESFIGMVDQLAKLVETSENDVNKQSALLSLEILARNFGSRNSNGFLKLVPMLIKTMCNSNPQVATSSVICLATLTTELGSLIIPYLPQFFPVLLKTIQGSFATTSTSTSTAPDVTKNKLLLQLSCLSSLEVIISQTSNFLNPYLNQILSAITHPNVVNSSNEKISVKVKSLMSIIASNVPARLLLPAVFSLYNTCISYSTSQSMLYLLDMLGDICSRLNQPTIQSQHRTIFKFFLLIFDYRQKKPDSESIDKVENKAVSAFLSLIIKLNETLFKPIFLALFDWAISTPNNVPRLAVFYRTLEALSDKLKAISIPYFGYVLDNSIELLSTQFVNNDTVHHNQLFRFLVSSLYRCFLYDTDGFINKEKFDKLLPVLVLQLESVEDNSEEYEDRMLNYLIPCLAQLAVCVGNDKLWKPLNYQVLLKTRSELPKVRFMALKVIEECYSKLGEELLVLLPETIPFLAELLEDSDSKVEKLCQDLIKSIETYLGTDSLSNYL